MTILNHALINARDSVLDVEVHAHAAERGAKVGKCKVADGWSGNGREPAVKNGIFRGKPSEHGQLLRRKVRHDGVGSGDRRALRGIAFDEALHICDTAGSRQSAEYLQVDARKVMVWVVIQLTMIFGVWLHFDRVSSRIRIRFIAGQTVDSWVRVFQSTEHVVERPASHH